LTTSERGGDNGAMTNPETTMPDGASTSPFQSGLRSLFLATAVVAVALGLMEWIGFRDFASVIFLPVQCLAVIAVLVRSGGTAWFGVLNGGLTAALLVIVLSEFDASFLNASCWASLAAWFGGGLTANAEAKRRAPFLRWAWLSASAWFLIVVVIEFTSFVLDPPD
jgi:hypothetical protein